MSMSEPAYFTAQQAERWGAVAEVHPLEHVLPRAQEIAEGLAARPQLLTRYLAVPCASASAGGWPKPLRSAWHSRALLQPTLPTSQADEGCPRLGHPARRNRASA